MHQGFKEWLVKDADKWTSNQRQNFLRLAKSNPDKAVKIIAENIKEWADQYFMESTTGFFNVDSNADAQELFQAYKEHFASELAATA